MKLLAVSDLHLGRRQHEFDLIEDQKHALKTIIKICLQKKPDVLLIAGDVYDSALPPRDAVSLLDDFLFELASLPLKVLMISGNHDSRERLNYGGRLFEDSGIYIAAEVEFPVKTVTLSDEYGSVRFTLLPYLRPADIRRFSEDSETVPDTLMKILNSAGEFSGREVILSHQFWLPLSGDIVRCDSETPTVGGLGGLPVSLLERYCYAALGHIHTPQSVGRSGVRYSGSILKYSASEVHSEKSLPFVTLGKNGLEDVELIRIEPLRQVRRIKGPLDELCAAAEREGVSEDYIYSVITDPMPDPNARQRLLRFYPNLMEMKIELPDNERTEFSSEAVTRKRAISEWFDEFYLKQNGISLEDSFGGSGAEVINKAVEAAGGEEALL
jgi:exonuclease SbcD